MYKNILCVIPARKGSKGVLHKNLCRVAGLPLFLFSVRQAIAADIPLKNIVVSSDDDQVLSLAQSWNVTPHRRPDEISGDDASTESALIDVLDSHDTSEIEALVTLQPTSPIRLQGRVMHAIETYLQNDCDSLLSTTKLYPFFWRNKTGTVSPEDRIWVSSYPAPCRPRRQDLKTEDYYYFDNGNIYISDKHMLRKRNCRVGFKPHIYQVSDIEGLQIDTPFDLELVDRVMSYDNILRFPIEEIHYAQSL